MSFMKSRWGFSPPRVDMWVELESYVPHLPSRELHQCKTVLKPAVLSCLASLKPNLVTKADTVYHHPCNNQGLLQVLKCKQVLACASEALLWRVCSSKCKEFWGNLGTFGKAQFICVFNFWQLALNCTNLTKQVPTWWRCECRMCCVVGT